MKSKYNGVYVISLILFLGIALFALFFNNQFETMSNNVFSFCTEKFSWLYLVSMLFFVFFVLFVAFSKYGNIRLGRDDSKPEYSTLSWFAMLFCAGMGVGLVFWGGSEPISHYINPMEGAGGTKESAEFAFKASFMHWGIHPWANYAVIGLALAYFQFRKEKPGLISSLLEPVVGRYAIGHWPGKIIDILASFATGAGVVTSLGLGVLQINKGLSLTIGLPNNLTSQIIIIFAITIIFMLSAVSGVEKGIKSLSNVTAIIACMFMVLAFMIGPKLTIVENLLNGVGNYLNDFIQDSLCITGYGDNSWVMGWRVFYWAWWVAWAPFVGIFIARISKGRTIREFVIGVVVAPALASIVWFAIFGTLGIDLGFNELLSREVMQEMSSVPEEGLFLVLNQYPLGKLMSFVAIFLLFGFFITSADSGTFVLATLSSDGDVNPSNIKKVVWGIVQSLLAIGLLITGNLKPLQTISIAAAFPFMVIMLGACVSLIKELRKEVSNEKNTEMGE